MSRENKQEMFCYLDHRTADMKFNIITDVYVTPDNVHDSVPYLSRLDRQVQRFGFKVEAVALDSSYLTSPICKGLSDRNILESSLIEDFILLLAYFLNGNLHTIKDVTYTFVPITKN